MKDAADVWLKKQQSGVPRKHYPVIYDNDDSMITMLRSIDSLAKDND